MTTGLTLVDCTTGPEPQKLKFKEALKRGRELAECALELPTSIPELADFIRLAACGDYKIRDRLALLQTLRGPFADLLQALHNRRIGISLPISEADQRLLAEVDGLLLDYVCGFHAVIEAGSDYSGFLKRSNNTLTAMGCFGAIAYQTRRLMLSYEAYQPVGQGVWQSIHQVYRLAREQDIDRVPLQLEDVDGTTYSSTVEQIYKRAILIGRSDPYHFSFRGVTRLFDALSDWPRDVKLSRRLDEARNDCLFVIDLDSDYAASPYFDNTTFEPAENLLVLDTSLLMQKLDKEHKDIMEQIVDGLKGISQIQAFERMEILRHIMVSWGVHPIRKSDREDRNVPCEVVMGLGNIYNLLHSHEISDEIDLDSTAEMQMMVGVFQEKFGAKRDVAKLISEWIIGNESSGGFSLHRADGGAPEMRVGELVALRKSAKDDWVVCITRWARSDEAGDVQAGLFRLGSAPIYMAIRPVDTGTDRHVEFTPALIISSDKSFANTGLIIAQKTVYAPKKNLWVKRDKRDQMAMATNLLASSRSVDVFAYRTDVGEHQRPFSHRETDRFKDENPLEMLHEQSVDIGRPRS